MPLERLLANPKTTTALLNVGVVVAGAVVNTYGPLLFSPRTPTNTSDRNIGSPVQSPRPK